MEPAREAGRSPIIRQFSRLMRPGGTGRNRRAGGSGELFVARSAALPIFLPRAWPRVSWPGPCRQSTTPAAKFSEINTFTSQTECQSRRIYAAVAQRKGRRLITSRLPGSIFLPGGRGFKSRLLHQRRKSSRGDCPTAQQRRQTPALAMPGSLLRT